MVKVLFINPSYQPHWSRCEPTGLLQLASYLRKNEIDVDLIDMNYSINNYKSLKEKILSYEPNYICIGINTRQADEGYNISRYIKKKINIKIKIIFGGVHSTFLPEEAFEEGDCDYVISGEAEIKLLKLINELENEASVQNVKGIYHKVNDKIIKIEGEEKCEDLDSLPIPAYDLIDFNYVNTNIHVPIAKGKAVHLLSSRGCPNNCKYCASPKLYNRKVRFRSPENVVNEIVHLYEKYNIKQIHFHDDNFLLDVKRIVKFCELLIEKNLEELYWIALGRVDTIVHNKELLPLMKKAGCLGLEIGVESAQRESLEVLNKGIDVEKIKEANRLIKKSGMLPMYLVISYCPEENIDSPFLLAKLLYELKTDKDVGKYIPNHKFEDHEIMGHMMRVSPGCEFFDDASEYGRILSKIWYDHIEEKINFVPTTFLEDVPIQTNYFKNPKQVLIESKELVTYYISKNFYASNITTGFNTKTMNEILYQLYDVYTYCDGKLTVDQIYMKVKEKLLLNSIEMVVGSVAILSMLRLIKSK